MKRICQITLLFIFILCLYLSVGSFSLAYAEPSEFVGVIDIEQNDNYCSYLLDNKITTRFDYGTGNAIKITLNSLTAPTQFALGNNYIIVLDGENIKLFSFNNFNYTEQSSTSFIGVKDLCYQNGYFYVLTSEKVFRTTENELNFTEYSLNQEQKEFFTVDILGNVHFGTEKITTDFECNEYTLSEIQTTFNSITAFSMSYDDNKIFYIENNLLKYDDILDNISISKIELPQIENNTASINEIQKIIIPKENAIAFKPDCENYIAETETEYLLKDNIGTYYVLQGKNGISLINQTQAEEKDILKTEVNKEIFITTSTLPLSSPINKENNEYKLDNFASLKTNEKVFAKYLISLFEQEFYLCEKTVNDETVKFYVLKSFTTENLCVGEEYNKYTVEQVKATDIFDNENLENKIDTLTENAEIRLYEINGSVAKIGYFSDNTLKVGYINSQYIIDKPNTTIRNILLILAVLTCFCVTASYFILRKRK